LYNSEGAIAENRMAPKSLKEMFGCCFSDGRFLAEDFLASELKLENKLAEDVRDMLQRKLVRRQGGVSV
jgi:hypothetical protein